MYLLAHTAVLIDRPRSVAFNYTANLENFAEWFPGVIRMAAANELPFDAVGKQYRETVAVPLRGLRQVDLQVIEVATPSRLVTQGTLKTVLPRMEIEFRDAGPDQCAVEWRMFSRTTGGVARWTILPLTRRLMKSRAHAAMQRLKHRLEAAPRRTEERA
ncbi:MAG: SRPBCC family protein [Rhizobacter sp.]